MLAPDWWDWFLWVSIWVMWGLTCYEALAMVGDAVLEPWLRRLAPWSRTWRLPALFGSRELSIGRRRDPNDVVWYLTIR